MRRRYGLCLLLLWTAACSQKQVAVAPPPPPPPPAVVANPQATALYANLWIQRSAEYQALCRQVYQDAERVILERFSRVRLSKPPAVILDLDETVIDNSGFQTWLHRQSATYSSGGWGQWERWQAGEGQVEAVPGALAFLRALEQAGVTPVFVSNRKESAREQTVKALVRLGALQHDEPERLLLRTDTSSKIERRAVVAEKWSVLALVGDNLADFDGVFEAEAGDLEARNARVAELADKWGSEWFVLPNPVYGDWVGALGPDLEQRLDGPAELPE
ncbi:MAG: 5'-nucleotidase, lipoprotein e(P4) family [Acidobacteria bacterium]|nr:5'-nucleotidase, lipoprotein e(P4) family [Acidobacteriota bacterium]